MNVYLIINSAKPCWDLERLCACGALSYISQSAKQCLVEYGVYLILIIYATFRQTGYFSLIGDVESIHGLLNFFTNDKAICEPFHANLRVVLCSGRSG